MNVEISDTELKRALQSIGPDPFEHFIGELWERKGWETTVSDAANDQGVDVRATKQSRPRTTHPTGTSRVSRPGS